MKYKKLYNKEEQLFKLDRHVGLFDIDKDNLIFKLFKDLIIELEAVQVECSIKFANGKLSPDRINLILDKSFLKNNIKILFKYMSKFEEFGYNFEELKEFNFLEDDFFLNKIRSIAFGLDLRKNPEETRIKFWVCGDNYNFSLFNYAYSKIEDKSKIDNLLIKNETIIGYDFYANGLNKLKIYPHFEYQELKNDRIRKILKEEFSPKINDLIDEAYMCYISFDEKFIERYIHITPHKLERILDKIDFEELKITIEKLKSIYTKCIITFVESELNENNLKTFNFYY